MNAARKTMLQRMDALVRWTKMPDRVKLDMAADSENRRRHRQKRWLPLLPMALGAGFVIVATVVQPPAWSFGLAGAFSALGATVNGNGPLGKSSLEDDEREAALRKDAWLFCLAVLAFANIVGQPALALMAMLQAWPVERIGGALFAVFMCNMLWLASLPTLYASWKLPKLQEE